ncbi:MAG: hypothetical protein AB7G39_18560 [Alphaproteobacteria bacterium]
MSEILLALETSGLGVAMRGSLWLYPVANILHVMGAGALLGAVLVTDLRLLGAAPALDRAALMRLTVPVMGVGAAVAVLAGFLMFAADPRVVGANPFFQAKLVLIALAIANALLFTRTETNRGAATAGFASLVVWTAVIACGRMIAYW